MTMLSFSSSDQGRSADRAWVIDVWEDIGRHGFTISVACGPCGAHPFCWTVTVLAPHGESFERPYAAATFTHAIEIALHEINRREWHRPGGGGSDDEA